MSLRLEDLRLRQGGFRLAASLEVPAGTVAAVIGPSGGGKSTLLLAVAGFVAPESGRILWEGADLAGRAPAERPASLLFQDNNLFPHLTVAQNVGLGLAPRLRLAAADRERVDTALARVGLGGMGERRPAELSGGQQSRAGLARVLVSGRPLVLMDEPFGALGPGLRGEMLDLVAEVLGGAARTVLMVTHDPEDARRIAGSVIVVEDGRATGPHATGPLLDDPPPGLARYLGRQNRRGAD